MIIDHPYVRSAKIVTRDENGGAGINTLVLETTVDINKPVAKDHRTHELMELLFQLRSFAEHDFADFQAVEVLYPPVHRAGRLTTMERIRV